MRNEQTVVRKIYYNVSCKDITLPIFSNLNENSEITLIELYQLYDSWYKFLTKIRSSGIDFDVLPYTIVAQLNTISEICISYLKTVGVDKYLPRIQYTNISPSHTTPLCQYFMEALEQQMRRLDDIFVEREITLTDLPIDTDFYN